MHENDILFPVPFSISLLLSDITGREQLCQNCYIIVTLPNLWKSQAILAAYNSEINSKKLMKLSYVS
jgi:hypothetical protein